MTITLNELNQKKNNNIDIENLQTLSADDLTNILPNKEAEPANTFMDDILADLGDDLDARINKHEEAKKEFIEQNEQDIDAAIFDAETEDEIIDVYKAASILEEDPSIKAGVDAVSNVTENPATADDMVDLLKELDDDFEDSDLEDDVVDITEFDDEESTEENDDEEQKKMLKDMQDQVEDIIRPFDNIVDLKSFSISTKPRSVSKVLKDIEEGPTATWVLLESGVPFTCTALRAVEIENLDPNKTNAQNGRIDALKQMYGTLFRHYTSANKPEYLEQLVKTIAFSDQDNLIFGYYKATFGNSNLITYACDKCKEVKIENVPLEKCIKYKDDETKKEVEHILKYGDPTHRGQIKSNLIQVSDTLAMSIKNPSIYNIVFEFGVLDAEFTNKYANVLGTIGYIEDIYIIDAENRQLVPVVVKEDPQNITKSVKRRIKSRVEILKGLTPDQYQILTSEIAKVSMNSEKITYCQPEYTCKKCGNVINETEMTAQEMLFIRQQLALIRTLSIE